MRYIEMINLDIVLYLFFEQKIEQTCQTYYDSAVNSNIKLGKINLITPKMHLYPGSYILHTDLEKKIKCKQKFKNVI